ncbi:MAG: hypothetical protein JWP29_622 [Rhodoferax sp.]|nr:hypothetical protein [Rhodoferax sp.]
MPQRPNIALRDLRTRLPALQAFITERGGEVLSPTNDFEVLRFRAQGGVHVVSRQASGHITYGGDSALAVQCWLAHLPWRGSDSHRGQAGKRLRSLNVRTLLERDGDACFLCGQALGDDITEEHLVPVTHGGPDHIANKVLAHAACNKRMGHLSVMEKIRLRDQELRAAC